MAITPSSRETSDVDAVAVGLCTRTFGVGLGRVAFAVPVRSVLAAGQSAYPRSRVRTVQIGWQVVARNWRRAYAIGYGPGRSSRLVPHDAARFLREPTDPPSPAAGVRPPARRPSCEVEEMVLTRVNCVPSAAAPCPRRTLPFVSDVFFFFFFFFFWTARTTISWTDRPPARERGRTHVLSANRRAGPVTVAGRARPR